jgi:hypothetical protein
VGSVSAKGHHALAINFARPQSRISCSAGPDGLKCVAKELGLTPSGLPSQGGNHILPALAPRHKSLPDPPLFLGELAEKLTDIAAGVGHSELSAFSRAAATLVRYEPPFLEAAPA